MFLFPLFCPLFSGMLIICVAESLLVYPSSVISFLIMSISLFSFSELWMILSKILTLYNLIFIALVAFLIICNPVINSKVKLFNSTFFFKSPISLLFLTYYLVILFSSSPLLKKSWEGETKNGIDDRDSVYPSGEQIKIVME